MRRWRRKVWKKTAMRTPVRSGMRRNFNRHCTIGLQPIVILQKLHGENYRACRKRFGDARVTAAYRPTSQIKRQTTRQAKRYPMYVAYSMTEECMHKHSHSSQLLHM